MEIILSFKFECCNPSWRPVNISRLEELLDSHLVGQHLARDLVIRSVRGHHSPSSLTLRSCCCLHAHHCPLNRLSLARLWLDLLLPGPVPQPSRCDTHMCTSHSAGAAATRAGVVFVCESVSCDDSSSFSSLQRQPQWLHL